MTREQFIERAIKAEERRLGIPPGWWGERIDVRGPQGQRVRLANGYVWVFSFYGGEVSRHDSRAFAIAKARKYPTAKARKFAGKPVGQ